MKTVEQFRMEWEEADSAARAEPVASKLVAASQAYSAWVQAETIELGRMSPMRRNAR